MKFLGKELVTLDYRRSLQRDLDRAKVKPYSDDDREKFGKRVSKHPLNDTYLGDQLKTRVHREAYYDIAGSSSFVADLDMGSEDMETTKPLKRIQRVFTSPMAALLEKWRQRRAESNRSIDDANADENAQTRFNFDE